MNELERLSKIIANRGYCSRRSAEELIVAKKVKVNGVIESELGKKFPSDSKIEIDGKELKPINSNQFVYLALNKPVGVICTAKDPEGRKTVLDLIPKKYGKVLPIGRLDINSEGLIFLSNDGEFINLITHPSSSPDKTYEVLIDSKLTQDQINELERGILLEDGMTSPCKVKQKEGSQPYYLITIHEGKNREVRRMMQYFSKNVINLKRISIGFVNLGKLEKGSVAELPSSVITRFKKECLNKKENNTFKH